MPDIETALVMLEYCRFSYKSYAQTCVYPMDPFFEAHGEGIWQGARDRVMARVHEERGSHADVRKFDPIEYDLTKVPNPSRGVVYRGGTGEQPYILFQPRPLDRSISDVMGADLQGNEIWGESIPHATGTKRCCHFQGKTGMTQSHPEAGWPSWMGVVVYDPIKQTIVITFRGSRSGSGGRALAQALTQSQGNPDWVTDMNHLKGIPVGRFGHATLSGGFWYSYESCKQSLEAAFYDAANHQPIKEIYFTGHSLGGGLAQCAYIDMAGGDLLATFRKHQPRVPMYCYAISAPPIILGSKSKALVERYLGDVNVFHYFAPKDTVHDSPSVKFSVAKGANTVVAALSHPLTSPCHIGVEFPLEKCKESFPDAHEPEAVRKGMFAAIAKERHMGLAPDPEFWPLFDFNPMGRWGRAVEEGWRGGGLNDYLKLALSSFSRDMATSRAELWAEAVKGQKSGSYASLEDTDGAVFQEFHQACSLVRELSNPFTENRHENAKALEESRGKLIKAYGGASGHKASSSVYWVMLQYLTARQYSLDI